MPVTDRGSGSEPFARPRSAMSKPAQHNPVDDLIEYLKDYAREKPEVAALWCFGIGFVLGWKLKPW